VPRRPLHICLCLWLVTSLSGCGTGLPAALPGFKPITQTDEESISRRFRREAKKSLKFIRDPEVQRFVDQVGRRILAAMEPQPFDYRFFIIENRELNAFAVPGGSIYIQSGLLMRVQSTDELAGVMGHEVVHVKARHLARLSGPDPLSLLGVLGIFLGGAGGAAQAAGTLGQALAVTRQLAYSRQLEQEADTVGVKYMAEAGYDPAGALQFLKLLWRERSLNPVDVPPYLMTHPVTEDRIAGVEAAIRSFKLSRARGGSVDPIGKIQTLLRLQSGEGEAVIQENERRLSQEPKAAGALHLLGLAEHHKGQWAAAQKHYEEARQLNPGLPGIDRDLGRLHAQQGNIAPARQAYERALEADPKESLTYLYLGELFEQEANFPEAARAYLRAHTLSPLWPEPALRLGIAYGKMQRLGDAHYYLARAHLLDDEDEKAVSDLRRALQIFGENSPRGQIIKEELEVIQRRGR
jgi:predicted Zn-dependent protease